MSLSGEIKDRYLKILKLNLTRDKAHKLGTTSSAYYSIL